jgi:hypothetical protein
MNLKIGMFRLWVVLSALWAIGATAFLRDQISAEQYEMAKAPLCAAKDGVRPSNCNPWEREWSTAQKEAMPIGTEIDGDVLKKPKPNWDRRFQAYLFIFIPPLLMFGLGIAFGWIIRGFRLKA